MIEKEGILDDPLVLSPSAVMEYFSDLDCQLMDLSYRFELQGVNDAFKIEGSKLTVQTRRVEDSGYYSLLLHIYDRSNSS